MYFRLSVFLKQGFLLPKTSHWELFGDGYCLQSILENFFTCKKFSNFQKCAFTDKVFRTLRSANNGFASGHHELFEEKPVENKFSTIKNFCFCTQTTRPCAVGEQCPASSWLFTGRAKTAFAAFGVRKLGNFLNLRQQHRHNHHLCHSVLWLNGIFYIRIIVQKYAHLSAVI